MNNSLPKWLVWGFIIISFLGFLDAGYLTVAHYTGADLKCSVVEGCDVVTTSKYSEIFGIPVSLIGMLYYLTVLIGSLLYVDTGNRKIFSFIQPLTILGFLASGYFVYLQLAVIEKICQYCMLSAATSTLLFVLGLLCFRYKE